MISKNIIWLASYPKSGNTWFRVFLSNLLNKTEQPVNINELMETAIASNRRLFDEYSGLNSSDLSHEEIDALRPDVYRLQSAETNQLIYKKVHDKFYYVRENQALFPPEISKGAIYFIRNPLDVLVSFAFHNAIDVEKMLEGFNNSSYALCAKQGKLHNQLRQLLGSWSEHVKSWTEQKELSVHLMRYEDMVKTPEETFTKAVRYIGLKHSKKEITEAIKKSDFSVLSTQEKEQGFKEKMIRSEAFFRKGKPGDWKNHLTDEMVNQIVSTHKETMIKYGYFIEQTGEILF